jgi:hypothetical protein
MSDAITENIEGHDLAQHIETVLKDKNVDAAVARVSQVVAIPPHIAGNLLEFLRRVESKGMEAVAWVEAYQFVQKHVPQQPGAVGLPPSPK